MMISLLKKSSIVVAALALFAGKTAEKEGGTAQ